MCVNVINLFRCNSGIADRHLDAACCTIRVRLCHMMGICAKTIANHFRINLGTAFLGMLQGFKNQNPCTFAHYESVTVYVKRAAGLLRLFVVCRHCSHGTKACHSGRTDGSLRTAADHRIRIAALDQAEGFPNRMASCCTSRHCCCIRTFCT
ncbi:hypothetical protein D3C73_1260040 [compost metagenome]